MRDRAIHPGYDGPGPTAGERRDGSRLVFDGRLAEQKTALVERIHRAMLTLRTLPKVSAPGFGVAWPDYIQEFSDAVGVEKQDAPIRFRPTRGDHDDMLAALQLLEGLRPEYFHVVLLKAAGDFFGRISWADIGDQFGRSEAWARDAYDRAIIQAARRVGIAPVAPEDYAVLCASVLSDQVFLTWIGTTKNPRQTLYDLKHKNALPVVDAFAVWVPGKPIAKRISEAARALHGHQRLRGAWFMANPFDVEDTILTQAIHANAAWKVESLASVLEGADAAEAVSVED